jgi:chromosome segregation ATPase
MKITLDQRISSSTLYIYIIFSFCISFSSFSYAEAIENLQKNASVTYEKMIQAKQSAETLAKDVAFAEKKLAAVKQKLSVAEQEVEAARTKLEQAKISKEQAINRWKQATDALANEWGKTEVK